MRVGYTGFRWLPSRSAWQEMELHRARRAESLKQDQANMEAVNSAMSTALQNRISQASNNAAEAALKRVKAAAKAKVDASTKQIDEAQRLIDTTQKSIPAASSSGSSTVLSTVA